MAVVGPGAIVGASLVVGAGTAAGFGDEEFGAGPFGYGQFAGGDPASAIIGIQLGGPTEAAALGFGTERLGLDPFGLYTLSTFVAGGVTVTDPSTLGRGLRLATPAPARSNGQQAAAGFANSAFAVAPFAGGSAPGDPGSSYNGFGHGAFSHVRFGGDAPNTVHARDPYIGALRAGHPNAGPGGTSTPSSAQELAGFGDEEFGAGPFGYGLFSGTVLTLGFGTERLGIDPFGLSATGTGPIAGGIGFGHGQFSRVPFGGTHTSETVVIDVVKRVAAGQARLTGPTSERVRFGTPTIGSKHYDLAPVRQALLTPSFTLYACDNRTGRIGFELPFSTLSWDTPLNAVGTLTADLVAEDVWDGLADQDERNPRQVFRDFLTGPWRWSFVLAFGDLAVWAGPYIAPKMDAAHPSIVSVGGSELLAIYGRRVLVKPGAPQPNHVAADTAFTNANLAEIALALFEQGTAGPGYELPINFPTVATGGAIIRTYWGYDLATYQDRILDLTKEENGPDVRLDPRIYTGDDANYVVWDLRIGQPHLGQTLAPWAWEHGAAGVQLGYDLDAKDVASTVYVGGSGQDRLKQIGSASDPKLINQGFPALDLLDGSHSSIGDVAQLNAWAAGDLTQHGIPQESWSVKVPAGGDPRIGQFRVGDDMLVGVPAHPLIPEGDYRRRITKIAGDASSFVTLTGDAPVGASTTTAAPITVNSEGQEIGGIDHTGMIQTEDGGWVFASYYHQGEVQLQDGSWVPKSYFQEAQSADDGSWIPTNVGAGAPTPDTTPPVTIDPYRNRFFIDISHFQTGFPLATAKAYGIEGCIAKIGQGSSAAQGFGATLDATWPGFRDTGRALWPQTMAGYWYLGDTESPVSQASRCANYIGDLSIPVMLDWEAGGGNWQNVLNVLAAFRAVGLKVTLLYVGKAFAQANGAANIDATGLGLIRPRYYISAAGTPDALAAQIPADTWDPFNGGTIDAVQFSSNATVIPGWNIDCDVFRGTSAGLARLFQTGSA